MTKSPVARPCGRAPGIVAGMSPTPPTAAGLSVLAMPSSLDESSNSYVGEAARVKGRKPGSQSQGQGVAVISCFVALSSARQASPSRWKRGLSRA